MEIKEKRKGIVKVSKRKWTVKIISIIILAISGFLIFCYVSQIYDSFSFPKNIYNMAENCSHICESSSESDWVFVGTIVDIDPPDKYYCGILPAFQVVTYEVKLILKSKPNYAELSKSFSADNSKKQISFESKDSRNLIRVAHFLLYGNKDIDKSTPQLIKDIFYVGNSRLVFANFDKARSYSVDKDLYTGVDTVNW